MKNTANWKWIRRRNGNSLKERIARPDSYRGKGSKGNALKYQ
jgi:hypothetical protein